MKFVALLSAGLVAAATMLPAAASAQVHHRTVTRTVVHTERHRGYGHTRRVCRVEYSHHRRARVCRIVRV